MSILREAVRAFLDHYCVTLLLDGLDECEPRQDLLSWLTEIAKNGDPIRVLATSRDELDIGQALQDFTRIRIETHRANVNEDIQLYTKARLEFEPGLHRLRSPLRSEIALCISRKSTGMFRWAQCQLDSIATLRTVRAVHQALEDLPAGLDETYANVLRKVPKNEAILVRRILSWLAFAVLPLTISEVYEAVAIERGTECLDEDPRLGSTTDILILCGNLISLSDRGHLGLAHLSVKDYLLSQTIRNEGKVSEYALDANSAYADLAMDCLTYLQFSELATGPSTSAEAYAQRLEQLPFLKHAATAWPYYVRSCPAPLELIDLTYQFFGSDKRPAFMSWVQVLNADYPFKWNRYSTHATPLYYAASFGLTSTVRHIVSQGVDLNAPGSCFGGTALHAAAWRGYTDAAAVLLDHGAEPNRSDVDGVSPLHSAASCGNLEMIRLLLKYGASRDVKDQDGETPDQWAVNAGYWRSERLILGQGNDESERRAVLEVEPAERSKVWTYPKSYYPSWYDKRSGMASSVILKVEIVSQMADHF